MPKRVARLLVLSFAFTWAWLLPALAHAAIVPVCDSPATASITPPPLDPVCAIVTTVDDSTGETTVAPICDARGASAIAPQRILPVSDARLDATPSCGEDPSAVALTPGRGSSPDARGFAVGEIGTTPSPSLVNLPRLLYVEGPAYPAPIGRACPGVRRGIDHPPR